MLSVARACYLHAHGSVRATKECETPCELLVMHEQHWDFTMKQLNFSSNMQLLASMCLVTCQKLRYHRFSMQPKAVSSQIRTNSSRPWWG